MFHKLRFKLTLINVMVMALLCLLLIIGTYVIMQIVIFNQSEQLLQIIATEAGSSPASEIRQHDPHMHVDKYFFVKIDPSGNIISSSIDSTLNSAQLKKLTDRALHRPGPRGEIDMEDQSFAYLKAPLLEGSGSLIAFIGLERDHDILRLLLATLAAGGIIYLVLAYFGSRFLADRAMRPIIQSWQRQQDFVADASHELRTPLAVIQTNLEVIRGNPDETVSNQDKWLGYIDIETKRLIKMVEDLLFLARADSAQQVLEFKEFPLRAAIRATIEPFQAVAAAKGIELSFTEGGELIISGDENKIKQLIVILLDNALKHTSSGGQISVSLRSRGTAAEIMISDSGEGIAPEHLTKIFERFYRVDKARSKHTGGSGLGLSIADWIVNSHHGQIKAASTPGQGTTFTVVLPNRIPKTTDK